MDTVAKLISWKNNKVNRPISTINITCDRIHSELRVRKAIIDALNNEPNVILQFDWSKFGQDGDYITVEDIKLGGNL